MSDFHRRNPSKFIDMRVYIRAFETPLEPATQETAAENQDSSTSTAQKRGISTVDGPNSPPPKQGGRKTFTDRQLEFREQQGLLKDDVGTKVQVLGATLKCSTSTCTNEHHYCWIEDGVHYNVNDHIQREQWARQWQAGEIDEFTPPPKIRKHLYLAEMDRKRLAPSAKKSRQQEREEQEERWREEDEQRRHEQREADRRRQERDDRIEQRQDRQAERYERQMEQYRSIKDQEQQMKMQRKIEKQREIMEESEDLLVIFTTLSDVLPRGLQDWNGGGGGGGGAIACLPRTFFKISCIRAFSFRLNTLATKSGRSWAFSPGRRFSVISRHLGLQVKVVKRSGRPNLEESAMAS